MWCGFSYFSPAMSPSSRRAWIEMMGGLGVYAQEDVALLAEGVDRNKDITAGSGVSDAVALLAEGVDRNMVSPLS